jgi:hypothetical protein
MTPLRKVNCIPETLNQGAIDRALEKFVVDSREIIGAVDPVGALQALRDGVASIVLFRNSPESFFWLSEGDDGEVAAWAMTQIKKSVDNTLCYWMLNAWVDPKYRFTPFVQESIAKVRKDAKWYGCRHLLIPSSRNAKAYCRFLGGGFHKYLTILKEDI